MSRSRRERSKRKLIRVYATLLSLEKEVDQQRALLVEASEKNISPDWFRRVRETLERYES